MKRCRIVILKYMLLIALSKFGVQVARGEINHGDKHNAVINETIEPHLWKIADSNLAIIHKNSIESGTSDKCEPNPCENEGTCILLGNKEITCICQEPFTGSRCEIDPCTPNPCKNNGSCEINEGAFECRCKDSFSGELCETVLDLCEENPCKNGGLCQIDNGQAKCDCIGPYAGEYCEKDCDCGDAVCKLDVNGYKKECNCTENQILLEGKCVDCDCGDAVCELDMNGYQKECNCTENQILHEGKCVECDCGERSRLCYFDYRGKKQCVCLEGAAQLGGTCSVCDCGENSRSCLFNSTGEIICYCKSGFSQKNDTCYETCKDDNGCFNWGICKKENDGNSYCKCLPGYSGGRCQTDDICESIKDKCDAMEALCKSDGSMGVCVCPLGKAYRWISGKCEDMCDPRKCNHGDCEGTGTHYKCICHPGFKGLNCDERVETSSDTTFEVIVLVILSVVIVGFIIGTIYLHQKNRKLIKSLGNTSAIHEPRI